MRKKQKKKNLNRNKILQPHNNRKYSLRKFDFKFDAFCQFILQHKLLFSGLIALAGLFLSFFSLMEPELQAVRGSLMVPVVQESALPTPDGIVIILEGVQLIRNKSLRGGGHVSDMKFIETSIETAFQPRAKLIELDQLPFARREERLIKYRILVLLVGILPDASFPPIDSKFQFLDHNGATIRASDSSKAHTLSLLIN